MDKTKTHKQKRNSLSKGTDKTKLPTKTKEPSFENYMNKSKSRRTKSSTQFESLNKHINFEREGKKSSPRKTPTEVICCVCHKKFTLPFKPRKPEIYCETCLHHKKLR